MALTAACTLPVATSAESGFSLGSREKFSEVSALGHLLYMQAEVLKKSAP